MDGQRAHERRELELALQRLSLLEQRTARVEILALRAGWPDDLAMPDQTPPPVVMPTGWRANRAIASLLSLHTLLMGLGALFLGLTTLPGLAPYAELLKLLAELCGVTAVPAMIAYKTPAEQAMLDHIKRAGLAATTPSSSSSASLRLVPLFLLLSVGLAGCAGARAWFNCLLGQLPQIAQLAIPGVTQALEQLDQGAAITAVNVATTAAGIAAAQAPCIVKAIQADELAKAERVRGQRTPASINIVRNADAYLQKYPPTACAPGFRPGPARASAPPDAVRRYGWSAPL